MRRGAVAAGTFPTAMFDSGRPATIVIVGTDILLYFMKIDRFEKVSREVMILALNDEGAIEVLGRIDLDVANSESAALTGNSWSGKSTLLHLAKGLDRVMSFHAELAGRYDRGWEHTLVEALRLQEYTSRYPEQLSGGQQQRVAIRPNAGCQTAAHSC